MTEPFDSDDDRATFDDEMRTQVAPCGTYLPELETERTLTVAVPEGDARASVTVLTGVGAGRIIALKQRSVVLGRAPTTDVKLDDLAVSRAHARISCEGDTYIIQDLGSANGTFLRGARIVRARLVSGDRVQLGPRAILRFAMTDQLERDLLKNLVASSTHDELTGACNRAFFVQRLEAEMAYARRHGTKVAVLLIDLDDFKAINDSSGHAAGDAVLRAVAAAIRATLRIEDLPARFGGDEFAVLARAASNLDAFRLAERMRTAIEALQVPVEGGSANVTASIGIAHYSECEEGCTPEQIVKLADERLYRAKAKGRNTTCVR
jgi:two-component system cell cycle response regulator